MCVLELLECVPEELFSLCVQELFVCAPEESSSKSVLVLFIRAQDLWTSVCVLELDFCVSGLLIYAPEPSSCVQASSICAPEVLTA